MHFFSWIVGQRHIRWAHGNCYPGPLPKIPASTMSAWFLFAISPVNAVEKHKDVLKTSRLQQSYKYQGVKIWNKISPTLKYQSYSNFSKQFTNLLVDQYQSKYNLLVSNKDVMKSYVHCNVIQSYLWYCYLLCRCFICYYSIIIIFFAILCLFFSLYVYRGSAARRLRSLAASWHEIYSNFFFNVGCNLLVNKIYIDWLIASYTAQRTF